MSFETYLPCVLSKETIAATWGHGYLEIVIPPDEEGDEVDEVEECAWLHGEVISQPSGYDYFNHYEHEEFMETYGEMWRIWDMRPTDEQRKATSWTTL